MFPLDGTILPALFYMVIFVEVISGSSEMGCGREGGIFSQVTAQSFEEGGKQTRRIFACCLYHYVELRGL